MAIPIGTLVFTDDSPCTFVEPDGTLLAAPASAPAPTGAGMFSGGLVALDDGHYGLYGAVNAPTASLDIFDAQFNLLASLVTLDGAGLASNFVDAFFILTSSNPLTGSVVDTLRKVDLTGAVVQSWSLGADFSTLGVAPDESFAYVANSPGVSTVKKFDLIGAGGLTTFVTASGPEAFDTVAQGGSMIAVLRDGTVLVCWDDQTGSDSFPYVRGYDSSGTPLWRRDFGSPGYAFMVSVSVAEDDLSFWVNWWSDADSLVHIEQVRTSDGAILQSFTKVPASMAGLGWDNAVFAVMPVAIGPAAHAHFRLPAALEGLEGPLYWTVLAHRDVDGTPKRFPWAPISIADPADYNDGFKDQLLLSVGDISFPLSDRNGLIQVPTCDVTYSDFPGADGLMPLRGMLGRDTQKALRGKEFTLYCITDEARRQFLQPLIVFRGFVDRPEGPPDYQFTIHAKGWIARRLDKKLWDDRIIDLFSEAPPDTQDRAVPIAFGVLSDEGSDAGPIVFVDDEAGRGGAGGALPLSSYGDLPVAAPTGLTASEAVGSGNINLGDNPGDAYYIMATRVVAGVEGQAEPFLPSSITPVVIGADAAAIDAACVNDGADAYRFYIGRIFTGTITFSHYLETTDPVTGVRFTDFPTLASQRATPITSGGVFAVNPFAYVAVAAVMNDGSRTAIFPGEFPTLAFVQSVGYNRPVRLAITPLAGVDYYEFYFRRHPTTAFDKRFIVPTTQLNSDLNVYWEYDWSSTGYEVINGAPVPSGVVTPVYVGKVKDLSNFEWDGWLMSGRPGWAYIAGYLNGVRIDEGQYGGDLVAPGKPGYTTAFGALPYTAGAYTPFMVFVRGPMASRILGIDGFDQEAFRVNIHGHANVADDDVETSIYEQFRMLAKNVVLTDTPLITGAFDQEPVFTDNTPRLDDASVDLAAEDALVVMPKGPSAARWLRGDLTVDQFIQDICLSAKMKVGNKPNGQVVAVVHNPDADAVADLDERFDVIDKRFSFQVTDQGFANALPYEYATHYDEFGELVYQTATPEEDAVSQSSDQYADRVPDAVLPFPWRRSAGIARGVAQALLRESRYMPQPAEADSMLHSVHLAPGEVVAVTHRQGATATGYTQRKHAILGMRIALERYVVGLTLLDLGKNVGDLSFFQSEDFMAGRWIGGARDNVCQTLGGVVVPYNSFEFLINWDEIPGTHGQRARILSAVSGGGGKTTKPSIFLAGEDPSGDTSVIEGANMTSATFDEQVLIIPRGTGEVRYWLLPKLSGGAGAGDAKIFGFLEGYRL